MSQRKLSRQASVSQGNISEMEQGRETPTRPTIERLAAELGADAEQGVAAAITDLAEGRFLVLPRSLIQEHTAGQIRVTLRSRLLRPDVRAILTAVLSQIEEGAKGGE